MYRAQRSSSNGGKEQLQQGAKEQQKGANRSSSFYSATNRFFYRFRTVRPFRLNGWGVSYNGKGRSVFVSFRKNGTITLYCHIPYFTKLLLLQHYKLFVHSRRTSITGSCLCHVCNHILTPVVARAVTSITSIDIYHNRMMES